MTKVFIEHFHCKTPCEIFVGKDALTNALYWIKNERLATDASFLYHLKYKFKSAVSWHKGKSSFDSVKEIEGNGVHLKMYETEEYLILSSQNNGHSALFESAIVFKKKPKLWEFFNHCYERANNYTRWWRVNNPYRTK